MLEIKEKDFNSFFNAPFNAYGEHSPYVSPLKSDFKRILSKINDTKSNYFITGKAGTGKSTLLKYLCNKTNKSCFFLK